MSKHTPGPWHKGKLLHDTVVLSEGNYRVGESSDAMLPLEERRANARLIAAAPELLEACKLVEKQLSEIYPQASTRSYLQAAIAKAEGR